MNIPIKLNENKQPRGRATEKLTKNEIKWNHTELMYLFVDHRIKCNFIV